MTDTADSRREHRDRLTQEREQRILERFKVSTQGLRRVFEKHFSEEPILTETLIFHLAKVEAQLPNIQAALRSARYPGAGDRSPRRFALGLWENLRAYENHLRSATLCLERLLDATEGEQESGAMDDFDPMEFLVDSPSTGDDSESAA